MEGRKFQKCRNSMLCGQRGSSGAQFKDSGGGAKKSWSKNPGGPEMFFHAFIFFAYEKISLRYGMQFNKRDKIGGGEFRKRNACFFSLLYEREYEGICKICQPHQFQLFFSVESV